MSNVIGSGGKFGEQILNTLRDIQREATNMNPDQSAKNQGDGMSFSDHLKQGIEDVNHQHKVADRMAMELSTGKTGNIHETMLAATQAELSFNLMVQLRNKALEAYSEIMRMPV